MYMPPMSTKKRAEHAPPPGLDATRRVFATYDENNKAGGSHYATIFTGKRHPSQPQPRVRSSTRHNKPHPEGVGFLLQDCATLQDPICNVKTKVDPADTHWWPSRANQDTNKNPVYTKDSTSRSDFKRHRDRPSGQTRHGSNPNKMAAQGPVPVTHLPHPTGPRLLVERISYQHGYNSRTANNQPTRGKLHGNFVWDCFHPTAQPATAMDPSSSPRSAPPGRGSESMRNIMTHDLTAESNRVMRHNRFPSNKRPLQPISGKIGLSEPRIAMSEVPSEGIRHDTLPPLPPIAT